MPLPAWIRRAPDAPDATQTHRTIKVVMLGESGVGKTSLFCRYVHNSFQPFVEPTIGAAFSTRTVSLNEDQDQIHLHIWDTAGQERYEGLTSLYFRNAGAAVLVYDITRIHSYQAMQRWMRQVQDAQAQQQEQQQEQSTTEGTDKLIRIIVGNKSDMEEHRSVSADDARDYAQSQGALYMETSAKDNDRVTDLFEWIARRALLTVEPDDGVATDGAVVHLGQNDASSRRSCC